MLGKRTRLDTATGRGGGRRRAQDAPVRARPAQQIERHYEQLQETRQTLHLTPENIQAVVEIALELAGQPPLRPVDRQVDGIRQRGSAFPPAAADGAAGRPAPKGWPIRTPARSARSSLTTSWPRGATTWCWPTSTTAWCRCPCACCAPRSGRPRGSKGLHRVTARRVPNHVLDTPAVIAHARLVVIGGDSHRLHEEIIAGGRHHPPGPLPPHERGPGEGCPAGR